MGDVHIFVTLYPPDDEIRGQPFQTLHLKCISNHRNGHDFESNISEMRNGQREILIGRAPECDLSINDRLLSKVQCHIRVMFDPDDLSNYDWVIVDGHNQKTSTNGTWIYISQDTEI